MYEIFHSTQSDTYLTGWGKHGIEYDLDTRRS